MVIKCLNYFKRVVSNGQILKSLTWINIQAIVLKACVLKVDLVYPKELQELHNDYLLAPDEIQIKREMLSEYELKIADLCNIPFGNVQKLVPNIV